jgi:hypothetical protein
VSHSLSNFSGRSLEDVMTNFAQLIPIAKSQIKAPSFSAPSSFSVTGLLTGLAFLIVFAIAIYLAARSPGTTPDAFASMTVFP